MLKVVAKMNLKSEEDMEKFLEIGRQVIEKTNALDKGCVSYELCQETQDPLQFVMLECWESQEALDNHTKAPHFTELVPKMDAYCIGGPNVTVYKKLL